MLRRIISNIRYVVVAAAFVAAALLSHNEAAASSLPTDSITEEIPDTTLLHGNWLDQVIEAGFHINDPRIRYPRFARWVLGVYNWGDRTFNRYDPEYVIATGKNWKTVAKNDLWMRNYILQLADRQTVHITSRLYDDLGVSLSFMAVSISYTWNLNHYFGDNTQRNRFDFNFTCSRFAMNYWRQSIDGGAVIRKFGDYRGGRRLDHKFSDISVDDNHLDLYYFFNHRHYSQAAAYCFSKYQLRSAGSWMLGVSYDRHNSWFDFSNLPEDMLRTLPTLQLKYHFRNTDYCILGGYAHNWVLRPRRWLINLTVLPFIGYKHQATNDMEDRDIKNMISTNLTAMASLVYNHRGIFAALQGRFNGFVNYSTDYTFANSNQMVTAVVGVRF